MFKKLNKEEIYRQNQGIDEEINGYKPETKEKKEEHPVKNIIGNLAGIGGTVATLIGSIGAAVLALNYIIGAFGLSALLTIVLLVGLGLALNFIGSKMITNPCIPTLQEV